MKLALVTDAWHPQVNGVVTTLRELVDALQAWGVEVQVLHPGLFRHRPCPGYAGIDLAVRPYKALRQMLLDSQADAIHLATEGPLGWAGRRVCREQGWAFTTAFHTKFPEILHSALKVPLGWGYALFRHFHRPSAGVMVPTQGVLEMLRARGFERLRPWTHGVDTGLFRYAETPLERPEWAHLPRPYWLFVGRVSYEKNIDAFLSLELPGTKIVCGVGPLEGKLRAQHPEVHWMGVLPREQLAQVYAAADVFVFPSRNETFGLVMLEAMAAGTPVAAYPVDGPLQVLGADAGRVQGGVLHEDLAQAAHSALQLPRAQARERAMAFGWSEAARLFADHLVAARSGRVLSRDCHDSVAKSDTEPIF
jgi:glycosyltransferase involved in cell wall biosynthesis